MALATEQGKEHAVEELKKRRETNKDIERVNNRDLYAGSPMYYYCHECGEEMILPESHTCPAPQLCDECKALKENGWLD